MTAPALLLELLRNGTQLWVEDDELCLRAARGTITPDLRAQLSQHKPEVITLLEPRARHALPSFSQQRMWLLDQLESGTPAYNISNTVRLAGRLNVETLGRSLEEIVSRHEALRTTFAAVDGEPVQVISPVTDVELPIEDLTTLPEAEREDEARRLARQEARSPFDLERGPLFRARLLRLGEEEHLLLLSV